MTVPERPVDDAAVVGGGLADSTNVDAGVVGGGPADSTNADTGAETVVGEAGPAETGSADAEAARPTLWDQIGGPMGMMDSGLPVVVFVIVNIIAGLGWAIGAALAAGVVIAVLRLARRRPVTQAIAGLFGVGIAAFIAYRVGSAKGYFLFGIWSYALYGSALLLSVLVRWPLIGVLWEGLNGRGNIWRRDRRRVRRYDLATLVWVAVFAARFAVQNLLYASDQVGWLATARLLMGYPLYLLAILVTVLVVGVHGGMRLPALLTRRIGAPGGSGGRGRRRSAGRTGHPDTG